jgi:hypothetical protein
LKGDFDLGFFFIGTGGGREGILIGGGVSCSVDTRDNVGFLLFGGLSDD